MMRLNCGKSRVNRDKRAQLFCPKKKAGTKPSCLAPRMAAGSKVANANVKLPTFAHDARSLLAKKAFFYIIITGQKKGAVLTH